MDVAYAEQTVKSAGVRESGTETVWEKRLYICAGFDDYRIATPA
jgi:hypothetical protein